MTKEEATFLRYAVVKLLALHRDGLTPEFQLSKIAQFIDENDDKPIDMFLSCPACFAQHIDESHKENGVQWDNPPHKSHLCHFCGCIWRPADVPTNGVKQIKTVGKNDTWTSQGIVP